MQIILNQGIRIKDKPYTVKFAYKTFTSNIIPHKGDLIADSLWKDPYEREVIEVIIDYNEDKCYVTVELIEFNSNIEESEVERFIEMAKLHGWKDSIRDI